MDTTYMTDEIKREIRAQLARRDMTQGDLAAKIGITEVQLSRMMQGRSDGSVKAWQAILDALGLELTVREKP